MSNLTQAPWRSDGYRVYAPMTDEGEPVLFEGKHLAGTAADMDHCALARNAFDVMMRRGWFIGGDGEGHWWPIGFQYGHVMRDAKNRPDELPEWSDPFTAMVEADQWYKEHVEKEQS